MTYSNNNDAVGCLPQAGWTIGPRKSGTARGLSAIIAAVLTLLLTQSFETARAMNPQSPTDATSAAAPLPAQTSEAASSHATTSQPQAALPEFDAASIKPSSNVGGGGRIGPTGGSPLSFNTPGRVIGKNVSTWRMILDAYHLTQYQLSGGPGWLDSESQRSKMDILVIDHVERPSEN
jgi:hypothetical protein